MPTRIPVRLIQKKLWRVVGFISTVIGLICYALSSSFKHLFGEWNFLKIIVYTVVSFSISSTMLFLKKWKLSRSFILKAYSGVLVLLLTSFYSFVSDKAVNGKPDLLSLISCAAFALMSLCLSRQIDLGFGADLLNFFLGCLTVQLMKINLMLSIVAAILCYSFIVLRSKMDSQPEIGTQGLENRVTVEIDAVERGGRGADHNRNHFRSDYANGLQHESLRRRMVVEDDNISDFQSDYNNGSRQIHHSLRSRMVDDGYNWKKYEEKQVKKNENLRSNYKCASPRCPVKKKIETNIDGQIIETLYKGNHNHCKPKFTLKSNSSFEYLYSLLPSKPVVPIDMPDQSFASDSHDCEQLDGDATPENSAVSI